MSNNLTRRRLVFGVGGSAAALIAAACGSGLSAPPTPAAKPTEAPKPAAQPTSAAPAQPTPASKAAAPAVTGGAPTEVQFWFWADSPDQAALHTDSLKKFQDQTPNIVVKTDLIATVADLRKKVLTSFAAQAGMPDCSHGQGAF